MGCGLSYFFFLPIMINLSTYWSLFWRGNVYKTLIGNNGVLSGSDCDFGVNIFMKCSILFNMCYVFWLRSLRGFECGVWGDHFYMSNFNISIIRGALIFSVMLLFVFYNSIISMMGYKSDYCFMIINLILCMPLLFFSNSLFTLFFIFELINVLMLYKFIVSSFWGNKGADANGSMQLQQFFSGVYLRMLFFHYWSGIFSAVLLMLVILSYMYIYGSTEWIILSSLDSIGMNQGGVGESFFYSYCGVVVIFSLVIKLGFAPLQLYKIEIYRGLPMFAILFYTTFYFLLYFIFFMILINYYFYAIFIKLWAYFYALLFIGMLYCIGILFDVQFISAFLAYSTILNILGFLVVLPLINY